MTISKLKPNDAKLIDSALSVLSPVWTAPILVQLSSGPKRTKQVLANLPGLTAKTFTVRVRVLERRGLVSRESFREVPPRVEYMLTDEGKKVIELLKSVEKVSGRLDPVERNNWGLPRSSQP